ncbi:haloacid dehalogenase [Hypericibacter adhaerens]|uniref:Haloacid dehalogenase n=1 Tax=Hypericibacter adhaerens TaxID=2602016 RepID=A0A5J6N4I6_9PROT|nr:TIGR01459 family HAD-type hydrolase [Hypericibacter adhaerens]QEX24344.1 haloacid dehalogenase [Hypericibacter adhaerens]
MTVSTLPPFIAGLAPVADRYDGYLVDLWGVMHNGVRPYPAAVACLAELKRRGKQVLLLSNAPRRSAEAERRLTAMGIERSLYDGLITSGEATWHDVKAFDTPFFEGLGRRCLPIMAPSDAGMLEGLGVTTVTEVAQADFILALGIEGPGDKLEKFQPLLEAAIRRRLPMVCANPDLEVMRGEAREICAGAIALAYEERGGRVRYHGKPHIGVYRRCFAALGGMAATRILAVGDSLRTDIAGAAAAGTDSLLILGGILEEQLGGPESIAAAAVDPARVGRLLDSSAARPGLLMARFGW